MVEWDERLGRRMLNSEAPDVKKYCGGAKPRRVGGPQRWALKVSGASPPGAAAGADLGGSSKYSSENLED